MQSLEGGTAVSFENHKLLDWILETRTKISPGHREKYNHAALHNAATSVGAKASIAFMKDAVRPAPFGSCRHPAVHVGPKS